MNTCELQATAPILSIAPNLGRSNRFWSTVMITGPLDWILGTTAKVQLLRALVPLRTSVTGREARRLARARSTAGVAKALSELTAMGILIQTGNPTTHQYHVNREHHLAPALQALFHAEDERIQRLVEMLGQAFVRSGSQEAIQGVILFGSQARGDARPESDVDLLVIARDPVTAAAAERAILEAVGDLQTVLGLRVSPLVIPTARLIERWKQGDPLMKSIQHEGRILWGESFDEVVSPW